ncbi:hypothetical protein GF326_01445 [Candidatus Bathyarchaeota archaeon]|nr:hypothetical protein [Candidatus Bathyarchaeota archaeon]
MNEDQIREITAKLLEDSAILERWLEKNELPDSQTFHALRTQIEKTIFDIDDLADAAS